jgi:hypothetical protein
MGHPDMVPAIEDQSFTALATEFNKQILANTPPE